MVKKGMSAIVGYVLLITFGIILSVIIYSYLKTYIPNEALDCPSSVSIFLRSYSCELSSDQLNLTFRNNGKFNLAGYFIFASNDSKINVATIEMVDKFEDGLNDPSMAVSNYILYNKSDSSNSLKPKEEFTHTYNISDIKDIEFIEIVPVRFQSDNGADRFVSCGKARIREKITCN